MPGPSWGVADEYAIQPRVYPFHDSTMFEVTGSCSVRALAADPILSDAWRPSRNAWQAGKAYIPDLMPAPDAADLMKDNAADRDKPAAPVTDAASEAVAAVLPPALATLGDGVAALRDDGGAKLEVPRNQQQEAINQQRQQQQLDALAGYSAKLEAYNAGLAEPGRFAVRM